MQERYSQACDATDKAKKVYAEAVHTFEKFFGVRKNLIFERARVNSMDKMVGESTEQYLLVLHAPARNCEYGQHREELIRDRIVIGILQYMERSIRKWVLWILFYNIKFKSIYLPKY